MIDLVLPDTPELPVDLEAEVLDRADVPLLEPPQPALEGRVFLGGPVAVPITASSYPDNPELVAFIKGDRGRFAYRLVVIAVTFDPERPKPRLETASVELRLTAPGAKEPPIAWSIAPARVTHPVHVTTSFQIGPQLTLAGVSAGVGSVGRVSEGDGEEVFLEASGELQSEPAWRFRRTRRMELRGSHRLVMVVRAAEGTPVHLDTVIRAGVVHGRALRRYRTALTPPLIVPSTLLLESRLLPLLLRIRLCDRKLSCLHESGRGFDCRKD